jgi:hypothetical protein
MALRTTDLHARKAVCVTSHRKEQQHSEEEAEGGLFIPNRRSNIMLKVRSLASLTARSLVVAVIAGTAMFVGGVANADTDENSGVSDPTSATDTSPTDTSPTDTTPTDTTPIGGLLPGGTGGLSGLLGPILDPILGGPAGGGTGGLNPGKLVSPILDPILGEVSDSTGLDLRQITGPILGGLGS